MYKDLKKILFSKKQIKKRVKEIGKQLNKDYEGKEPVVIGVLKGSVVFYSDLVREIKGQITMDFITLSSYGDGTESSGKVKVVTDLKVDICNRDVIIVEDIVDSGTTLKNLVHLLRERNPKSLKVVVLLDKYKNRKIPFEADYCGFKTENEFVVGYGLDYAQKYRNLPEIGVIDPKCI